MLAIDGVDSHLGNAMGRPRGMVGLRVISHGFVNNGPNFKANIILYWEKTKFLMLLKYSSPEISLKDYLVMDWNAFNFGGLVGQNLWVYCIQKTRNKQVFFLCSFFYKLEIGFCY